jgi:hypothetical protein
VDHNVDVRPCVDGLLDPLASFAPAPIGADEAPKVEIVTA